MSLSNPRLEADEAQTAGQLVWWQGMRDQVTMRRRCFLECRLAMAYMGSLFERYALRIATDDPRSARATKV
jgi:hypothetical protein